MKTTTTTPTRTELKKAYMFIVNNWAVGTDEVTTSLKADKAQTRKVLARLENKGLITSIHVNNEKALTWQSNYDIENSVESETLKSATDDFNKAFPTKQVKKHECGHKASQRHNSGPTYTDDQLSQALQMRKELGMSWTNIAGALGIKVPARLSMRVRRDLDPSA